MKNIHFIMFDEHIHLDDGLAILVDRNHLKVIDKCDLKFK